MNETELSAWLARGHRALRDTIPPRTRKEFADLMLDSGLWSSARLKRDSAIAQVTECMSPQKGDRSFRISELWLWMHESGNHALFEAMGDDLGRRTDVIPTEELKQKVLAQIDSRTAELLEGLGELRLLRAKYTGTSAPELELPAPSVPVRFSRDGEQERGF